MSVGAKVVLEYNLCPELGLCNGVTGTVKDIIYGDKDNNKPPRLPKFCWVEIGEYIGNSFFQMKMKKAKSGFQYTPLLLKIIPQEINFIEDYAPFETSLGMDHLESTGSNNT